MFKWPGSGSNHPFANSRKVKERLADLPSEDPLKAITELSDWIESLPGLSLARRSEACMLFDEHSQIHRRKLAKAYYSAEGIQQKTIGFAFLRFATLIGQCHLSCIRGYRSGEKGADEIRRDLPLLICRTINALKSQYKWSHLDSGLIDDSVWNGLFWLFAFAEKTGIARFGLPLYPLLEYKTSIQQEFLKTLMIAASSPDALKPWEFEMASHFISCFAVHFVISSDRRVPHLTHLIDLASNRPPVRLQPSIPDSPSLRFFGPGKAFALIEQILNSGELPAEITKGGIYAFEESTHVLTHLLAHWSTQPLLRKSERQCVAVPIVVAYRLDFAETDRWMSENISDGGYDAVMEKEILEWEQIGLLFFSRQDDSWNLSVIRRLSRDSRKRWHAGVEILARNIRPTELRSENSLVPAAAVLIDEKAREARILAGVSNFSPNSRYEIDHEGKTSVLVPLEILGKGSDFRLWRFRLTNS